MKIGDHIIIGVAPGWIFVGHVKMFDDKLLVLNPAGWVENVTAQWTDYAWDKGKISTFGEVRGDLVLRQHAILWHADCGDSLIYKKALDAVERA